MQTAILSEASNRVAAAETDADDTSVCSYRTHESDRRYSYSGVYAAEDYLFPFQSSPVQNLTMRSMIPMPSQQFHSMPASGYSYLPPEDFGPIIQEPPTGKSRKEKKKRHSPSKGTHTKRRVSDSGSTQHPSWKKWTLRIYVPSTIYNDTGFRSARVLIGKEGANTKLIYEQTGCKVRVRGKNTGAREGPSYQESMEDQMLCVSGSDKTSFAKAKKMAVTLFEDMLSQYYDYCRSNNICFKVYDVMDHLEEGQKS